MTLVRFKNDYTPTFDSLFGSSFNNALTDFFSDSFSIRQIPAVNLKENENDYQIELAVPGRSKEDFKISLEKNILTISSEKETENKDEKDGYMRREFSFDSFKRSFSLPENASRDDIKANYENGILLITILKNVKEQDSTKHIEIA